jgi:DNA-binding response OmpR family regulator
LEKALMGSIELIRPQRVTPRLANSDMTGQPFGMEVWSLGGDPQAIGSETPRLSSRILLIGDDRSAESAIAEFLRKNGLSIVVASTRDRLSDRLAGTEPNLVILDINRATIYGFDLLRQIRSHSNLPLIVTAGQHTEEADRVVGLELGADDFVTRPFGYLELLARIRAVLRRDRLVGKPRSAQQKRFRFGGWQIDSRYKRLRDIHGTVVPLSKSEYTLLLAFLEAPQRPLTRAFLLQATRLHDDLLDRSIDVQVLRLRRRLQTDPHKPDIIQTLRGIGYMFTLPVDQT